MGLVLAASMGFAATMPAHAATIVVTTTSDPALASTSCPAATNPCSLRAAVAAANAAGGANTITFAVDGVFPVLAVSGGNIEVTGSPVQQLTISGNGVGKTIIDGQGEDHRILLIDRGATVGITGATIRNAHGLQGIFEDGAGINSSGSLTLTAVSVSGNELDASGSSLSAVGAGIVAVGPLTVVDSTVTGNTLHADITGATNATASGAGIFVQQLYTNAPAPVSIKNSVVSGNSVNVTGAGGGGFASLGGGVSVDFCCQNDMRNTVAVESSTLSGNSIVDHSTGGTFIVEGGAIETDGSPSTLILNSTVDANAVSSDHGPSVGGGVAVGGSANAVLTNLTLSGNSASSGASLYSERNSIHLRSTILTSASASGCSAQSGASIVSDGDNLDSGTSCGLTQLSDQSGVNPMLGPLQDNGGLTPTRALLPGSPAIDAVQAADCPPPSADQRGVTRPQGPRCDIGAFERNFPPRIAAVVGSDGAPYAKRDLQAFVPLGGALVAAPAVVSVPNGNSGAPLYLGVGSDHNVYVRTAALGWRALDDHPVFCLDDPAAVVTGGNLVVACQGADHQLYMAQGTVTANAAPLFTGGWQALGGYIQNGPAVAVVPGRGLDIEVVGGAHQIFEYYGGTFHPNPFYCTGHPALASDNAGNAFFACHGMDGALYWAQNSGAGWSAATSLGGGLLDGPAIAATGDGPVFYVEGTDHGLYHRGTITGYERDGGYVQFGTGAAAL
jgi:hypothetical protein